ncbi:MAG: RNA recognition motif domain-containing protein [Bacteriovoracaceae bacterium]
MSSKLYVGNISFNTSEEDLNTLFGEFGEVSSARIITDRETGRSRGFGFVEMSNNDEAQAAIDSLDGKEFGGRNLRINFAKERTERPPRRNFDRPRGGNY